MSDEQIGPILALLLVLIAAAHLLGYFFARIRQPRVIGEIAAGILVGPSVLGKIAPGVYGTLFQGHSSPRPVAEVLDFIYAMGLVLLMFVSGSEIRRLFGRDDRRQVVWLASVGTGLPFLAAILLAPMFPLYKFAGPSGSTTALLLVIGIAVAVTSIPVISRIFHDLGIMHTRFARLVMAVAVIEDVGLWAVLAVATSLAKSASIPHNEIFRHIFLTVVYFTAGLIAAPQILRIFNRARWNVLAQAAPAAYLIAIIFFYCSLATLLRVNLVFASFLAGYAVAQDREFFAGAIEAVSRFAFAFFIPLYFLLVGFRLKIDGQYSVLMLIVFLGIACGIKLLSVSLGATLAGFRGLDVLNLAVATNARGGPGIVLASVAYSAGIVNAQAFTTLVLVAVFTSQAAGAWLETVLRKGWPLLSGAKISSLKPAEAGEDLRAA